MELSICSMDFGSITLKIEGKYFSGRKAGHIQYDIVEKPVIVQYNDKYFLGIVKAVDRQDKDLPYLVRFLDSCSVETDWGTWFGPESVFIGNYEVKQLQALLPEYFI